MDTANGKKSITLDDLALMVANGFNDIGGRIDKVEGRLSTLEQEMSKLRNEMEGLRSSVNNYLKLSDQHYLELKARQNIMAGWLKQIGDKTGVAVNLKELENNI